ncbi:MAG: molybdopterin-dependent oxidoreductase, partial [Deltaproteobacteria bacterium]|nr:molybdopterin-dependent oxidoreductase [Deltaproteobacteria bacterium]
MGATVKDGVARTSCGLCLAFCGMLVHLKDGKVIKIEGDPQSPQKGFLCIKGLVADERLYHPDRIKHPQKRVGERGEGKWERISWDEALDTVANKMIELKAAHGAESVAFMIGSAKGYHMESLVGRFANLFGTPNLAASSHVCHQPRQFASALTMGALPMPDFEYPP